MSNKKSTENIIAKNHGAELISAIGKSIGRMAAEKNISYNNSYVRTVEFLHLLFPDGISPKQLHLVAPVVRWWDKTNRMISNPNAYGENPRIDMVGYAILDVFASAIEEYERTGNIESVSKILEAYGDENDIKVE